MAITHKLSPAEERRAKTNSSVRGGYIAVVNFHPKRRPVRGVRSELVTTEGAARRAAEDLKSRCWSHAVREACYFRVDPLGRPDMQFEAVTV